MPIASFHDETFPLRIAAGAGGGPVRRTEVVALASGREQRNQRWAHSRRRYDAGTGVKTLDDLHEVMGFFEARAGRLFAFRFRDPLDHRSCAPSQDPSPFDQYLGAGDGATAAFQLVKQVNAAAGLPPRPILKPVSGSVRVAVDGAELEPGDFTVDHAAGIVAFLPGAVPLAGQSVTAGFRFDVPARFDTDELRTDIVGFRAGQIPSIPILEVLA